MYTRGTSRSQANWSINCGLWRTDAGFQSTIQIKNRIVTGPTTAKPVLFMADGTEYDLPPITLPAAGVTTISLNDALARISPGAIGITSHLSQYGSAAIQFTGLPTAIGAQTAFGSLSLSLSYVSRFTSIATKTTPSSQTLEGIWWARDSGIGGFVSLSNATAETRDVSVQSVSASGQSQVAQSFVLAPHANRMLDLLSLVGSSLNAGDAGGLRVQFNGRMGEVNVTAGLENRQEGYSAVMPFWMPPMASMGAASGAVTLVHPGIMVGTPDPLMGFPLSTRFLPYLALRNITPHSAAVNLTLYTEQGVSLTAPVQTLEP